MNALPPISPLGFTAYRPWARLLPWVLTVCLLGLPALVSAQSESPSTAFPAERWEEIREELDYVEDPDQKRRREEAEAKQKAEEDDEPWWDGDFGDWDIDLSMSEPVSYLILGLLLLPIGYLVYRILGDIDMRRRTKREGNEEEERITLEEIEEEKLVASGVSLSLLERAERARQFDVAVRLLYIQLLKSLQDAGQIKYRRDFSNRDYQRQLAGTDLVTDFRGVTYDYERFWFGKYPIDRLSYRLVQRKFNALNERLARLNQTVEDYD